MSERQNDHLDRSNGVKEVNLVDYLFILVRWRKIVFWIVGVSTLVTAILVFLILSRWYKATAVIMPPKQQGQFSMASVLSKAVPLAALGLGKASDEMYTYMALLQSETCLEEIVRRFNLVERYKCRSVQEAARELTDNYTVGLAREDAVLEVVVFDTDSTTAAQMANAFVDVLNQQYLKLMTVEARSNREFLERRFQENMKDLSQAEEALRSYQEQSGIYSIPDQIKAAVQAAAEIKSQAMAKEMQLSILRRGLGEDDPRVQGVRVELGELNRKLREMKYGGDTVKEAEVFAPFRKTPELAMNYLRRFREVEIQQKLMEVLFPLLEQARIEEHRDTPTILVVDRAVPPDRAAKPRRILVTVVVALVSFILAVFVVFGLDYLRRLRTELNVSSDGRVKYLLSELRWKKIFSPGKSDTKIEA
jgi:tyrosine-protein kinase Etk/Wzc